MKYLHILLLTAFSLFAIGGSISDQRGKVQVPKSLKIFFIKKTFKISKRCPTAPNEALHDARIMLITILESSLYENDRNELGINYLEANDIVLLTNNTYSTTCRQINHITTINGTDSMTNKWYKLYYKVGSYYFVVYTSKRTMLGFSPVYMFNQNYELKSAWSL